MNNNIGNRILKLVPVENDIDNIFKEKLNNIREKQKFSTVYEEYRKGAESIRYVRRRLNLSRKEFSILIGIGADSIGKWERAEVRPRYHTILIIKSILKQCGYPEYSKMILLQDFGYKLDAEIDTDKT